MVRAEGYFISRRGRQGYAEDAEIMICGLCGSLRLREKQSRQFHAEGAKVSRKGRRDEKRRERRGISLRTLRLPLDGIFASLRFAVLCGFARKVSSAESAEIILLELHDSNMR